MGGIILQCVQRDVRCYSYLVVPYSEQLNDCLLHSTNRARELDHERALRRTKHLIVYQPGRDSTRSTLPIVLGWS